MMVFRCDRCGAEANTALSFAKGRVIGAFGSTLAELCKDCTLDLDAWVKAGKPPTIRAGTATAHASDCRCNRCIGAPLWMASEPVKLA